MTTTITITVPEKVEVALSEEAGRLGTTPELLVTRILHERFEHVDRVDDSSDNGAKPVPNNLAEFLGEFVGCLDSSRNTGAESKLSERTSDEFGEILAQKRREGLEIVP